MTGAILLLFASAASQVADQFQRDWQNYVMQTAKPWATKPGSPDDIVDAALVRCRDKFDAMALAQIDVAKEIGLNQAQADEYEAFTAASLVRVARPFASDAVITARGRK